jgi:hypothetical protein
MKRLRHPLIVASLLATSGMLILLALSPSWAARSIAAKLHQRINASDEPTALSLIESLAALDAAGAPHLLALLDDSRAPVRHAARRAMSQRLDAWSAQRTSASQRNIEHLATLLATHEPPREFHSREFVKLLALKLLRCSDNVPEKDRVQFLGDCSTVLERSVNTTENQTATAPPTRPSETPIEMPWSDSAAAAIPLEPYSPDMNDSAKAETQPDAREEALGPPERIELHQPRPIGRVLDAAGPVIDEAALDDLPTRSLIRRLHAVPTVAKLVEAALRKRGFDETAIEVARKLDHADPKVRQQLAESLPRLSGIDAAPWLWELAEDEDENVRRAARTILATSSNPQTRARVGRLK